MAGTQDFRDFSFTRSRVDACGRYLGHQSYWKLFSIENYLRVILHSVLSAQIAPNWWDSTVDPNTKKNILRVKKDYLKKGAGTSPGKHDIYYVYLSDLTKIMAITRHLMIRVIADVDTWIAKVEAVRIPRNIVGHMNFPNIADRKKIDVLHGELTTLVQKLEKTAGVKIQIP
jgi:hypothetical protein